MSEPGVLEDEKSLTSVEEDELGTRSALHQDARYARGAGA